MHTHTHTHALTLTHTHTPTRVGTSAAPGVEKVEAVAAGAI